MPPKTVRRCFFSCEGKYQLFSFPKDVPTTKLWEAFIFAGQQPQQNVFICGRHFSDDCFHNKAQYDAGFASQLVLRQGSVPTIKSTHQGLKPQAFIKSSASIHFPKSDCACQTDPPKTHSVGTQLSLRTLQPHFRSAGVQATASCNNCGVGTSTEGPLSSSVRRPLKRPHVKLEEDDDKPLQGNSSLAAAKGQDSISDPSGSVTLTESTVLSPEASTATHQTNKYIVSESCIMELFAGCPMCTRVCDVRTRELGTFLSVEQRCPHCQFYRHWNSQPVLGSTQAENLNLSAAVQLSGASFFNPDEAEPMDGNHSIVIDISEINEEDSDTVDESDHVPEDDSDEDWMSEGEDLLEEYSEIDYDDDDGDGDEDDDHTLQKNMQLCTDCGTFFRKRWPHTCEHITKPFPCNTCGKRFITETSLNAHGKTHEEDYKYWCKFCSLAFKIKANKLKHEELHITTDVKPYKCRKCSETFSTHKQRNAHLKTHAKCHICGVAFRSILYLQRHLTVHTGEKPFKCSVCERGFNQAGHLKSHMRLHTGERPFKCKHCDKSFTHNVSLKSHVQRYHTSSTGLEQKKFKKSESSLKKTGNNKCTDSAFDNEEEEQEQKTEKRVKIKRYRKSTGRPIGRPKRTSSENVTEEFYMESQNSNSPTEKNHETEAPENSER